MDLIHTKHFLVISHLSRALNKNSITFYVCTIFLCFLYFQASHPDLYIPLHEAWATLYPPKLSGNSGLDSDDDDRPKDGEDSESGGYVPPAVSTGVPVKGSWDWNYSSLPTTDQEGIDSPSGGYANAVGKAVFSAAASNPTVAKAVTGHIISAAAANPAAAADFAATVVSARVVKL